MMAEPFMQPSGIIPAMVTPLTEAGELNETSLRRLTNRLIEGGVHGLFPIGSQGEFWAFSAQEKERVWQVVVEETNGRLPVYAGTAAITTREAIELTQRAEGCGVQAVSILTPFFLSPSQDELYDHYSSIAKSTSLPILLYGNPARTGVSLSIDLVQRLARIDNIVGIKDSSGQLALTAGYITATGEDFSVLMGNDALIFGALAYGAKGAIAATANIVPALVARIYTAYQAGEMEQARRAQAKLAPLRGAFSWGTFPVVIKEALDLMGEAGGPARAPVGPMSPEARQRLQSVLADLGAV
jgi:4-hydroxy-tetrahydrodipicolinate synthase